MSNFYDEDLAYVHHEGFGEFSLQAGRQILGILAGKGLSDGPVTDLGCGSGLWTGLLQKAGFDVLGIDVSAAMVALARTHVPGARFEHSSIHAFELPPCQAITALGEVLNYGTVGHPDDGELTELFRRVAASLPTGGLFLFDVIVADEAVNLDYSSWRKGADWAVLFSSKEDKESQRLEREITVFRKVNGHYRRSEEMHSVRVFDKQHLSDLLESCGFQVTSATRYGDYALAPRRLAYFAIRQ